jgi:predicted AlkP superfamily pyrophosphatase or phosphodiesterase
MKIIITAFFCFFTVCVSAQTDTTQQIIPNRKNSKYQQGKPYVILISADGFRYDYAKKYNATHLLALSNGGVSAASMIPSYPSTTFPNHYTLVTGLYPSHHGIVSNQFYSPKLDRAYHYKSKAVAEAVWYGGTPLWTLAGQQHMLSASFYWVGSEAAEKGISPTYYYHYNELIKIDERIKIVKNWLNMPAGKRPHFITIYFPEVDHVSHKKGPDAPETEQAVHFIDSAVYELTKAAKQTGKKVNFIFVSDHGMAQIPTTNPIITPAVIDTTGFIISGEGVLVNIYAKKGHENAINIVYKALLKEAKDYDVYLKSNVPAKLHYSTADDWHSVIGDIIMIPHYPHVFKLNSKWVDPGCHGYDPFAVKDMHATFYAWGPNFKTHLKIPSFRNVDVYPVITKILGLKHTEKIDGTSIIANKIVSPPAP